MKRSVEIDLAKTIAIFGVVMIHVTAQFLLLHGTVGTWQYDSAIFWRVLAGLGVPLFLMCSGALMLRPEKELTLKRLYLHNVLRLVVAMLVWAIAYKLWIPLLKHQLTAAFVIQSVKEVLVFNQQFHLYYIHIMLLVYFLLPVTRSFVKNASEKEMRYFLAFWFVFGILYPTVRGFWPFNLISGIPVQWALNMTYAAVGYCVLGWYLKEKMPSVKLGAVLAAVGFASVLLPIIIITRAQGALYQAFLEVMTVGMCLYAAGVYILCLHAGRSMKRGKGFVAYMSKASFCIYLCHMFVLYTMDKFGAFDFAVPLVAAPLLTLAIVAVSTAVYWVISHIPVLKNWIV